jgi:hypothetical protein
MSCDQLAFDLAAVLRRASVDHYHSVVPLRKITVVKAMKSQGGATRNAELESVYTPAIQY